MTMKAKMIARTTSYLVITGHEDPPISWGFPPFQDCRPHQPTVVQPFCHEPFRKIKTSWNIIFFLWLEFQNIAIYWLKEIWNILSNLTWPPRLLPQPLRRVVTVGAQITIRDFFLNQDFSIEAYELLQNHRIALWLVKVAIFAGLAGNRAPDSWICLFSILLIWL